MEGTRTPQLTRVASIIMYIDLLDKDVNLDAELSNQLIEDTAILKKPTDTQPIRVEQKKQKALFARLHAKPWISCNLVPQILNATDADHRRNIL
jgi:phage/plasmid-associated DNA primase